MPLPRPRTIRGQLMGALVLFEIIVLVIFTVLLVHQQNRELYLRLHRNLENQAFLIASQGSMAVADGHLDSFQRVVSDATQEASVSAAQITDLQGRTLASTDPTMVGKLALTTREQKHLRDIRGTVIFPSSAKEWEAVAPILDGGKTRYLVWIYRDGTLDRQDLHSLLKITALWAVFVMISCTAIGAMLSQSITRQLTMLTRATRRMSLDPESTGAFPLPVSSTNEAGELTTAFNRMVAAIQEQRAGLNETLALLDSMLANAPIGFAFFDRKYRFVRVNQFLADMNGYSFALHLGRGVNGVLPASAAETLEAGIEAVFAKGEPLRDLELSWETETGRPRSWTAHLYPVRTEFDNTRWVGAILVDTTEQRRAEEALRRSEKLAAAGRLAASIAHEINNPLEAVTNLLFLIRQEKLSPAAQRFADLAQQEVSRVSEITQQTLRFYRQSTLPGKTNVRELLSSVLTLHQGRVQSLQVDLVRDFPGDYPLFCFAGELRQLFANLIGNALDAMMTGGGRLTVRARNAVENGRPGVRVTVADTGSGISPEARRHIFEPFFTTKEATGTGLGLWVSEQIIRKHRATLRVRSSIAGPVTGTVFSVFFPADGLKASPEPAGAEEEKAVSPGVV
jgi:PAS domain S-box-containing protein